MKIFGFAVGVLLLAVFVSNASTATCRCGLLGEGTNSCVNHETCIKNTITAQEPPKNIHFASPAAIREAAAARMTHSTAVSMNARPRRAGRNRGCVKNIPNYRPSDLNTLSLLSVDNDTPVVPRFEPIGGGCFESKATAASFTSSIGSSGSPSSYRQSFSVTPAKPFMPECTCNSPSSSFQSSSTSGSVLKGRRGGTCPNHPYGFAAHGVSGPAVGGSIAGTLALSGIFNTGNNYVQRPSTSLSSSLSSTLNTKSENETSCDTKKYGHVLPFEEQEKIYNSKNTRYSTSGPAIPADPVSIALVFNQLFSPIGSKTSFGKDKNTFDPVRILGFGQTRVPTDERNSKTTCNVAEENLSLSPSHPIQLNLQSGPCGVVKETREDIAIVKAMAREIQDQKNDAPCANAGAIVTYRDLGYKTVEPGCHKFVSRSSCPSSPCGGCSICSAGVNVVGSTPLHPAPLLPGPLLPGPVLSGPSPCGSAPGLISPGPLPYGRPSGSCGCPPGAPCSCGSFSVNSPSSFGTIGYSRFDQGMFPSIRRVNSPCDIDDDVDEYDNGRQDFGCN